MAENNKDSLSDSLIKGAETANKIRGAVKTGKAIAGMSKGAAVGGPYGAAAMAVWQNKELIGKIILSAGLVLMIPILFILMLPSLIFGGLTNSSSTPVLNDDTAIHGNIERAEVAISEILVEAHDSVIAQINSDITSKGNTVLTEIIDDFSSGVSFNSTVLISQYCASVDDFTEIDVNHLKNKIKAKKSHLFSYSVASGTDTDSGKTKYTYTVAFVGESYFATLFDLDDDKMKRAYDYAENLTLYLYGSHLIGGTASVSAAVMGYRDLITKYADQFGISEYVDILSCIMMAESGGAGTDVMQSSESGYNTRFPNSPNGITDAEYSIAVGVETFAVCIRKSGCTSPTDMSKLNMAIQGYNYGDGYIDWALSKYGGYSAANAQEFSNKKKAELGWSGYGNPQYVSAVMKYYLDNSGGGSEGWGSPFVGKDWKSRVTSEYGYRVDPVTGKQGAFHAGIDIGFVNGTPINVIKDGTVTEVVFGTSGYGYYVKVDHGGGYQTLYGHCSALLVRVGQKVKQGDVIAKVGDTGKSTGNHLHLDVYVNGSPENPRKFIN